MIKNERQYRITVAAARKFREALEKDPEPPAPEVDPIVAQASRDAIAAQLADLEAEIAEYERLKARLPPDAEVLAHSKFRDIQRIDEWIIKARIAAGLTQHDLAKCLGMKPQQIQRYEANDYKSVSLARLQEIAIAIEENAKRENNQN